MTRFFIKAGVVVLLALSNEATATSQDSQIQFKLVKSSSKSYSWNLADGLLINNGHNPVKVSWGGCPIDYKVSQGAKVIYSFDSTPHCSTILYSYQIPPQKSIKIVTGIRISNNSIKINKNLLVSGIVKFEAPQIHQINIAFKNIPIEQSNK